MELYKNRTVASVVSDNYKSTRAVTISNSSEDESSPESEICYSHLTATSEFDYTASTTSSTSLTVTLASNLLQHLNCPKPSDLARKMKHLGMSPCYPEACVKYAT